jgi:putative addiction module component (TIGR02574 family)
MGRKEATEAPPDRVWYHQLMSERARKLLRDAMDLPLSERAELAADLLASLDGEPEADVEAAWASEIERRAREALANPDDDVAWETS